MPLVALLAQIRSHTPILALDSSHGIVSLFFGCKARLNAQLLHALSEDRLPLPS